MQVRPRVAPKSPWTKRWTSPDGVSAIAAPSPCSSSVVAKKTCATAMAATMVKRSEASLRAIPLLCSLTARYGKRTNLVHGVDHSERLEATSRSLRLRCVRAQGRVGKAVVCALLVAGVAAPARAAGSYTHVVCADAATGR